MTAWSPVAVQAAWFVAAYVASALATSWLVGWAAAQGVIDTPNARSSHTRATPRGGGLAIVAVTSWAAIVAAVLHPAAWQSLASVIAPALAIATVSWLDDLASLRNQVRFGVHLAAAAAVTALLGPVQQVSLGSLGPCNLGLAAWPLTLLWIVGMTNAFNFMDGIDGIAGITAAAAGAALAAAAGVLGYDAVSVVALSFAAAAAGFLACNWPPARIFMGDVGSAFCGFMIAVLPLAGGSATASRLVPVAAITMWPFIFDTAFTLCRRLSRGENVFQAHRSHLYQRLVIAGWSHRAVSSLYGGLSAMAAVIAVAPLAGLCSTATATSLASAMVLVGAALLLVLVHVSASGIHAEGRKPSDAP